MKRISTALASIGSASLTWVMLTLATVPIFLSAQGGYLEKHRIIIVGSGNPADGCSIAVPATVYPEMVDIGLLDWNARCEAEGWGNPDRTVSTE